MQESTDVTIEVTLPQALLFDTGVTPEEAGHALVRAFVLSLYRRDRISSGKAAFIQMLAEEGIPYLDYTPAELDHELATLKQWRNQ